MAASIRYLLFDAVGTLICPAPPAATIYHEVAARLGSQRTRAEIQTRFRAALQQDNEMSAEATSEQQELERWRRIVSATCDDLGPHAETAFQELWAHFARPSSWQLYPDVAPTWQELQRRGVACGVASNFDQRLEHLCRDLPWLQDCPWVFHSAMLGARKPHRAFFTAIETRLQCPADQLLLVGDDLLADEHGARQAGWRGVWLDRQGEGSDSSVGSSARVTSLAELLELPELLTSIT